MRRSVALAPPYVWPSVKSVRLGMTGGLTLYYKLSIGQPIVDEAGRWRRDARHRTALEAFGALPIEAMYARLQASDDAWRALPEPRRHAILKRDPEHRQRQWRGCLAELLDFVNVFGPLAFDWSRDFEVGNPAADRARHDLDKLRTEATLVALGQTTKEAAAAVARIPPSRHDWRVTFPGPGWSLPNVRVTTAYPDLSWNDRVDRGDDDLPHDFLGPGRSGPLWFHMDDLRRAIELVRALSAAPPKPLDIRQALGGMPGVARYRVNEPSRRDAVGIYWQDVIRGPASLRGVIEPFKEHPSRVDWVAAGRSGLAQFLSEQLAWAGVGAGLDRFGVVRGRWYVGSLVEVIYLQLLEHVEARLDFGVGECRECGGPILNSRRPGPTRNVAHFGCSALVRKRRQRARERLARAEDASTASRHP